MRARRALALLALGLVASVTDAATPAAAKVPSAVPDLFGGYSYTEAGEASLNGIDLSGSYPLGRTLSLVLDISGYDGSFAGADLGQLGLMAGVRWKAKSGRLRPFAEGLLGGVRTSASVDVGGASLSDSDADWGFAFGGGVDYRLKGRWSLRGLFHLRLLEGEGAWDTDPRFAVGAVYRLGE
jgi:opacity protein-like surface antigen